MNARTLLSLLFLLIHLLLRAQGDWTQAVQSSAPTLEGGTVTRYCPDNGVVSIGYYRDQATFGNTTLPGGFPGQNVVFVVKHSASGTVQWAHAITNTDPNRWVVGHGLDVDGDGNIIVGGTGIDSILVDGVHVSHNTTAPDGEALFVIKFSPAGAVLWATDVETSTVGIDLMELVVDPADDIWFCGPISSTVSKVFKLNGTNGNQLFASDPISGQVRHIDADALGSIYLRGQTTTAFTLSGISCPLNSVLGGNTTNWTGKLNSSGVAQWFHVPDQGHLGLSPWQQANQAVAGDGSCYVEAYSDMRIGNDTLSVGANQRGLYLLDADGAPLWWQRLNRSGSIDVQDMATDPFGNCWITGKCAGVIDLIDTVVAHTGFFAFHIGTDGRVLQRIFGPPVERAYSVDVIEGEAVFGGEYSSTISFGDHAITDNLRGLYVARYSFPMDVGIAATEANERITAYPNPAQDEVRLSGVPPGSATVSVLNTAGQVLRKWDRFNAIADALDLNGLPVGMLLIRITHGMFERSLPVMRVH